MLEAARACPNLSFVNLGGGLGVPSEPESSPLDLMEFSAQFGEAMKSFSSEHGAEIWFEPGRFFVAESGVLLVTVTTVKDNGDRCFAGVDSGMGHLVRPAMYGSYHEILNMSNPSGEPRTYDIVGNICETGDRFARDRSIPEIREGDCLAILDTGAYGISMASEYNPARFRTITERQSPAQMVAQLMRRSLD
jgi:diaminopimelate decarboxylase